MELFPLYIFLWCFGGSLIHIAFEDKIGPRRSQQIVFTLISGPFTWLAHWLTFR